MRLTLRVSQTSELLPRLLDSRPDVLDGGRDGWISCGPDLLGVEMKWRQGSPYAVTGLAPAA